MFEKMKGMLFQAAIVACFQLVLAAQSGGPDQTDFSGTWVLNSAQSDTVSPGGMGGPGGQGMTLVISQEGGQGGGFEFSLEPGAGPQEVSTGMGGMTVEANWDGRKLIVRQIQDRDTPRGAMKIEQDQTWELSADGQTLVQKIKMKTPRGDRNLTLVFDKQ